MDDDYNFSVQLLKDKKTAKIRFRAGQFVSVKKNKTDQLYIVGYPELTLEDEDFATPISEVILWKLLLQGDAK